MSIEPVAPLPVRVIAADDESGISSLARTFWKNGTTKRRAEAWLHVPLDQPWRSAEVRTLAWATQSSYEWLSHRSFLHSEVRTDSWCRFAGHAFRSTASPPGRSARLCWQCVRERGYCKASWLLRTVSRCADHGLLMEACPRCGRRITWDRPAIDVCVCGRYFMPDRGEDVLSAQPSAWTRWIEWRLGFAQIRPGASDGFVPPVLDALSIDGASRLVEAFGLLRTAGDSSRGATVAARTAEGFANVIERGLRRLAAIDGELDAMRALADELHVPALERLRSIAVSEADSACAALLLRQLQNTRDAQVDLRGRYGRGQRMLFE